MRILTFTNLFPTSADPTHGIFVYQRVSHLAKRAGVECRTVAPVPFFPRWLTIGRWQNAARLPSQEEIAGLLVYHPRYFMLPKISMRWQGLSMFLRCLPLVWAIHRRWKIDCIDAHYLYPDGFAAVLMARFLGIPVVVSARGSDVNLLPEFRLVRGMIRWTLSRAAAVVAVSAALKSAMVQLGAAAGNIHVIPNGVDPARFQPSSAADARRRLVLPELSPIIVSVGTLTPSKGHELVIRAVAQIRSRYPGLRLCIIGEGPHRKFLERAVADLGMAGNVMLVGKRPNEELRDWFSAATVSCLASAREGWPNVITESLACGTPVVATSVGGIPEIVYSEDLGILVEPNVDAVARGLERALAKPWDRAEVARQARRRTWNHVAEELEQLFRAQVTRNYGERGSARTEPKNVNV